MSTDNTGAQALKSILDQVDKINAEYNSILAEVPTHAEQLAKARAALGKFHTRLTAMRDSARTLSGEVWRMPYDSVPRDTRAKVANVVHALSSMLDELVWKLFDFREGP